MICTRVLPVFGLVMVVFALGLWQMQRSPGKPQAPANSIELIQQADPDAILNHIKSLNSPLVLVNFWASWCEPCKVEFPHLLTLKQRYADAGLKLVLISIDDPGDLEAAEAFLKEQKVDFPSFYKGSQSLGFISKIYPDWSGAVPASVIFGPEGKILEGWEGDTSLQEFEERIAKHLKVKGS